MKRVLVTGSSGLIGSEAVRCFDGLGWEVVGIDNNMRADFLGPAADTTSNLRLLTEQTRRFRHESIDLRSRRAVGLLLARERFDLIIHCAAQPSAELARRRPLDDFDVNAAGTMNLLEAARQSCAEAPLVTLSTRRVYGDAPLSRPMQELSTRYDYARAEDREGIGEGCPVDGVARGVFGTSKLAADLLTQEYGRTFGLPTCVLRCGSVTGPGQAGVMQHGWLNHMARVVLAGGTFVIRGHKGKQVRDPLHAADAVAAILAFARSPRNGEVYNLGGGRVNSVSLLECLARLEQATGRAPRTEYQPVPPAPGDLPCWISDTTRFRSHYPEWAVTRNLDGILEDMIRADWACRSPGSAREPARPRRPRPAVPREASMVRRILQAGDLPAALPDRIAGLPDPSSPLPVPPSIPAVAWQP